MTSTAAYPAIHVTRVAERTFRCVSRSHVVFTDRPAQEGGSDKGPTSGELLLMAVGSCAAGSLRRHFAERQSAADFSVDVSLVDGAAGTPRPIRIALSLPAGLAPPDIEAARTAALTGGVVSRIAKSSKIEIVVAPREAREEA